MKNLSIILNGVLLVAVGVLYFLHFSGSKSANKVSTISSAELSNLPIAYINSDSLANYDLFKKVKKELDEKKSKLEGEYGSRARSLENEIAAYQQSSGNMTVNEIKLTEEKLVSKQQQLLQYKDQLAQQLMQEEAKMNNELYNKIEAYLQNYGNEKNYLLILGYTKGGGILYAHDSLEITKDIINGLNEEYKNNLTAKEGK